MPAKVDFDSIDLLFHFTTADTAVNHILPSGKLRLSPLGNTRDPIEYRSFDPTIYGANHPEHVPEAYLVKDSDYRDESEFRIVMTAEHTEYLFLDTRQSLVGVILGDRFPEDSIPAVRRMLHGFSTEVVQLHWGSRSPGIMRIDESER